MIWENDLLKNTEKLFLLQRQTINHEMCGRVAKALKKGQSLLAEAGQNEQSSRRQFAQELKTIIDDTEAEERKFRAQFAQELQVVMNHQ